MKKNKIILLSIIVGIPTLYALVARILFGVDDWGKLLGVMSISFLFFVPFVTGMLTMFFSKPEALEKIRYRIIMPWVPIFAFFIITIFLAIEGWACWIMILPLFMILASLGGLVGGYILTRTDKRNTYVTAFALLPFLFSPLENMIAKIPGTYKAYTYIDIEAPANKIWSNVTRVSEISEEQDKGWITRSLGFPRPVKAELNYEGVGAYREAIFTNGLVFHETVSEYTEQKKMVFSIKAYPHEIPATTMDEHVVIGGEYFDVLNGTYELEKLKDNTYRLHLYSHFKLTTNFNFYASWWARLIMSDIQNNILQVVKERAEGK